MNEISLDKQPTQATKDIRRGRSGSHVRVSDADRDRVAEILREALAEGRLTSEEHAERVEAAYAAKTSGQFEPLLRDLPAGREGSAAVKLPPKASGGNLVAIFGAATRKGRWRVGRKLTAFSCFGGVDIDLTEALYEQREVVIHATAIFGGVDIRVPENVTLRNGGSGIMGGFEVEEQDSDDPDAPVVIVQGLAIIGGVEAKAKKGKRVRDLRAHRD